MKKLIDLMIRYWKLKIQCKTSERKQIQRLDEVTKQLYEVVAGMNIIIDEYLDESYKEKFKKEHKKYKDLERESKEIIQEFTEQLKNMEKEMKKLEKEKK